MAKLDLIFDNFHDCETLIPISEDTKPSDIIDMVRDFLSCIDTSMISSARLDGNTLDIDNLDCIYSMNLI